MGLSQGLKETKGCLIEGNKGLSYGWDGAMEISVEYGHVNFLP